MWGIIKHNWVAILFLVSAAVVTLKMLEAQRETYLAISEVNSILTQQNEDMRAEVKGIREQLIRNNESISLYYSRVSRNFNTMEAKVASIESMSKREDVVVRRPTLVAVKANKAITKYEEEFACLTGNLVYCH